MYIYILKGFLQGQKLYAINKIIKRLVSLKLILLNTYFHNLKPFKHNYVNKETFLCHTYIQSTKYLLVKNQLKLVLDTGIEKIL